MDYRSHSHETGGPTYEPTKPQGAWGVITRLLAQDGAGRPGLSPVPDLPTGATFVADPASLP